MDTKTFTYAGVSTLKGVTKVRFANDALRVKVLAKNGHTDIDMIDLPEPMTKDQVIDHLVSIDFATQHGVTNAETAAAIQEALDARLPKVKPVKAPKAVKAPKVKSPVAEVAGDAVTAVELENVSELENAPY